MKIEKRLTFLIGLDDAYDEKNKFIGDISWSNECMTFSPLDMAGINKLHIHSKFPDFFFKHFQLDIDNDVLIKSGLIGLCSKLLQTYNLAKAKTYDTFVFRYPESTLHPTIQSKFLVALMDIATEENVKIVIETHSSVFINKIGNLIVSDQFSCDDAVIYFCSTQESEPREITFYDDGCLNNFPLGFFQEDYKYSLERHNPELSPS